MNLVVSDTSSLTNLAAIGQFELLKRMYGFVHIAQAVWNELNANGQRWPGCDEVAAANWIRQHIPTNRLLIASLCQDLDRGESESIALALELNASFIILDERDGRHKAIQLGLKPIGVVGILLSAKSKGMIQEIKPLLYALRQKAGFYISNSLFTEVIRLAGEERI